MKPASQIAAGVFFALSKKMKVGIKLKVGIKMKPGFPISFFWLALEGSGTFEIFFALIATSKAWILPGPKLAQGYARQKTRLTSRSRRRGWLEIVTDRRPNHPQGRGLEAQGEQSSRGRETRARASCKSSRRGERLSQQSTHSALFTGAESPVTFSLKFNLRTTGGAVYPLPSFKNFQNMKVI